MNKDSFFGISTPLKDVPEIAKKISSLKGVKGVYLFGSQATGKTHSKSDIDLCVIGEEDDENLESQLLKYMTDNLDISYFSRLPIPIRFRVFKEGKPLVINDKAYITNLKIITLNQYLDIKPLIQRYLLERFGCTI